MMIPAGFGRLTGTLLRTVQADGVPTPVTDATVKLHATPLRIRGESVLYGADTIVCTTDKDGKLLGPDGVEGVVVLASDGPTEPSGFTWRVTVASPSMGSSSWQVFVPQGVETDLFEAIPVPGDPGKAVLEWVKARDEALARIEETASEIRRTLVSFYPTDTEGVVEAHFPVDALTSDPLVEDILIGDARDC